MMNPKTTLSFLTGWLAMAGTAHAHPGHGAAGDGNQLVHYLLQPAHNWPTLAAAAAGALAMGVVFFKLRQGRKTKRAKR